MKIEATFNFGGFYDSIHSNNIESFVEDEEYFYFKEQSKYENKFNRDLLEDSDLSFFELYDYKKTHINYSKELVKVLSGYIKEEDKFIKSVEFIQLDSPKFYNYSTDTIQVVLEIDEDSKMRIFEDVDLSDYTSNQAVEDSTSIDGYVAFKTYEELVSLNNEYIYGYLLDYYYKENKRDIISDILEVSHELVEVKEEHSVIYNNLKY